MLPSLVWPPAWGDRGLPSTFPPWDLVVLAVTCVGEPFDGTCACLPCSPVAFLCLRPGRSLLLSAVTPTSEAGDSSSPGASVKIAVTQVCPILLGVLNSFQEKKEKCRLCVSNWLFLILNLFFGILKTYLVCEISGSKRRSKYGLYIERGGKIKPVN